MPLQGEIPLFPFLEVFRYEVSVYIFFGGVRATACRCRVRHILDSKACHIMRRIRKSNFLSGLATR